MIIFIYISESLKMFIPKFLGSTVSRATQSMEKYYRKNMFMTFVFLRPALM